MDRLEAQKIVAEKSTGSLTDQMVSDILFEYWNYKSREEVLLDIEDGELPKLEGETIEYMLSGPLPNSPDRSLCKPLLLDMQIYRLNRVVNSYLEEKLRAYGYCVTISGNPMQAGVCPCCNHYSIAPGDEGYQEICSVCFWQNGGDGPNHISLAEAQENFLKFGAMDRGALKFIDPEGKIKYAKKA